MRYYSLILKTSTEEIKEKSRVNLKEYGYNDVLTSLNNYYYRNIKNNIAFLGYREEENTIYAIFLYDEKKYTFQEAHTYISENLADVFSVKRISDFHEISMYEAYEDFREAQRREHINYSSNGFIDIAKLWVFQCRFWDEPESIGFMFREKIISETNKQKEQLADKSFTKELCNIESHVNNAGKNENLIHYIIASRSIEAALDMSEHLVHNLVTAKRISSRRVEIISEIEPSAYKKDYLEKILENSCGGTVIIDLSEKFGYDPTDYAMVSKYIENLVKKYRNQCLFIFTYNMDAPGFSYRLLPNLSKYILPVQLREGTGDRTAAISYLRSLILESEYATYADQAEEFLKQFSGNVYTQTDVLMAYEQFGTWCLNKNILQAYDFQSLDEFVLDRNENATSVYKKLQQMIGLETVKKQIDSVIAADIVEKERKRRSGKAYTTNTMHMIFCGNPGTAKTTVAKLFAGIAKEKNILKSGAFVERGGVDLNGIGCVYKIREAFDAANGGVLFIDEAYAMKSATAITVLLQEMENQRENVIVILAGYNERMKEFMELNEGLKSRIPYWIDFPDYNADELTDIFKMILKERCFDITDDALTEAHYIFDKMQHIDNFGNGRYVRNFVEKTIRRQSVRLLTEKGEASDICKEELFLLTKEDLSTSEEAQEERKRDTAQQKLNEMIGLSSVRAVLRKIIANYKLNKICVEKGIPKRNASLHMVFTGNPGTCKTTVACLLAEIMKDEHILSTGRFVEVGRADLVGQFVGSTAPLIQKKFKEAQGGILFVDEAYSLCDAQENGFGDEAINTLVQEMENHRDNVIVIFAGYPKPMQQFLKKNSGMRSRIAFYVEFPDYSTDELCEITKLMLAKKQMSITAEAMEKLRSCYEDMRKSGDFGNGRFVRNMLEEAEMNLAERILQSGEEITLDSISMIDVCDIPKMHVAEKVETGKIGFVAE